MQTSEQQRTGCIARKSTACSIRPVHAGRQTDNQESRVTGAKAGHRTVVIIGMGNTRRIKVSYQSRASSALRIEALFDRRGHQAE